MTNEATYDSISCWKIMLFSPGGACGAQDRVSAAYSFFAWGVIV